MKKLLLVTVIGVLTCANAHANPMTVPDEMLGTWCPVMGSTHDYLRAKKMGHHCLKIAHPGPRNTYVMLIGEGMCVFTNTERRAIVDFEEPYSVSQYTVTMECPDKTTGTFQLIGGKLTFTNPFQ